MTEERRRAPVNPWSVRGWGEVARRVLPPQSQFSVVTAMIFTSLWIAMVIDIYIGHTHVDRAGVLGWTIYFGVLAFVPLMLGRRFPRWMGIGFVLLLTYWSGYSLLFATHAHMEVNSLLEAPVMAVYLGWFFRLGPARVVMVLHLAVLVLTSLLRQNSDPFEFSSPVALTYALIISGICLEAAAAVRRYARNQYARDPLTGVLNRRGLVEQGKRALARARQTGESLNLAIVDLDDFKEVNDTGGHAEGDRALRETSAAWVSGLGAEDLVARTGGDEFVLLIHGTEEEACAKLQQIAETTEFLWSWGMVPAREDAGLDDLIARADTELYVQKREKKQLR